MEARRLAPATINLRLAAVRRLAYEASDNGLLSPDLAASIRRVKGAKKLGTRLGNWLTCAQGRRLLEAPDRANKGQKRSCHSGPPAGLRLEACRVIGLKLAHLQQRDDHWAIIDLFGKGGHVRTVPVPDWVKAAVDEWLTAACIEDGLIFRCVTHSGTVWGSGISEKVVWWVVRQCARKAAIDKVAPMTFGVPVHGSAIQPVESWSKSSSCLDIALSRPRNDILALGRGSCMRSTTSWASSRMQRQAEEVTLNPTLQVVREHTILIS